MDRMDRMDLMDLMDRMDLVDRMDKMDTEEKAGSGFLESDAVIDRREENICFGSSRICGKRQR